MANAKHDGVYTLDGSRFLIHKGETLPEGAVLDGDGDAAPETPETSPDASKGAAVEPTAAAATGPSETTDAVSTPSETA